MIWLGIGIGLVVGVVASSVTLLLTIGNKLVKRYKELEEAYNADEDMLYEHDIIFENLIEDPLCLSKAKDAYEDVCTAIRKSFGRGNDIYRIIKEAKLVYSSTSINQYDSENDEITVSLFCDTNDENWDFIFDYVNDKYDVSLNGSDIRTRIIFTILHELGHYIDLSKVKKAGKINFYKKKNYMERQVIYNMEYGPKSWQAYRELSSEAIADKFAINFMLEYFPELCYEVYDIRL
jgi:hypothetical protein